MALMPQGPAPPKAFAERKAELEQRALVVFREPPVSSQLADISRELRLAVQRFWRAHPTSPSPGAASILAWFYNHRASLNSAIGSG